MYVCLVISQDQEGRSHTVGTDAGACPKPLKCLLLVWCYTSGSLCMASCRSTGSLNSVVLVWILW